VPTPTKGPRLGRDPAQLEQMRFLIANPTASLYNNRTQILAAIEFACLDVLGQKWNVPVHDILGGRVRDRVPFASYLFFRYANPADGTGEVLFHALLVVPSLALALLVVHVDLPTFAGLAAFAASFLIGYLIGFCINFILNCTAFWTLEISAVQLIVTWLTDFLALEIEDAHEGFRDARGQKRLGGDADRVPGDGHVAHRLRHGGAEVFVGLGLQRL